MPACRTMGSDAATGTSDAMIPFVWSDSCLNHDPAAEIWLGVRTPGTEVPDRIRVVRDELQAAGHKEIPAQSHSDDLLLRVHDPALVNFLTGAFQEWASGGYDVDPGQDRVVPYFFPSAEMMHGLPGGRMRATHARTGEFCYDTMTLIGPGTWLAARSAIDVALSAVDLVIAGAPAAFGACRPPGHHVTRASYGGSCYLNNAAVAAEALRSNGHAKVAVIDIDAHHGNGTQAIFYERSDVAFASVHVDPGAGWFPHAVGFADELGRNAGYGMNLNLPQSPGAGDASWLAAVERAAGFVANFGATALVLSLGVDAAIDDPESTLQITADGYERAGQIIGQLKLPTVSVLEGGYHLPSIGILVSATLRGLGG